MSKKRKHGKHRKRRSVYPWSVLASLKGDPMACLKYMLAKQNKTRSSRRWVKKLDRILRGGKP